MHLSYPPALPNLPLRPGRFGRILAMLALCIIPTLARVHAQAQGAPGSWWDAGIDALLAQAGTNRPALVQALAQAPEQQREGWRFLLENMPKPDLEGVPAALLATNVTLAYAAFDRAPWKASVPRDLFLNDILPYASVNEQRDDWRQRLFSIAAPLVKGCKTPGEAAQKLNRELFPLLKVRYSTQRRRADQGPLETMASGMATCTGLSILLVDACRAVGIPARVVGVPLWANKRGNHTWVEIWDNGWHFTGAAEPDPNGLNKGWFVHDASQANKEIPEHAIYASSFRRTGLHFPMVWARSIQWVPAINVTDHYTPKPTSTPATAAAQRAAPDAGQAATNAFRLMVRVLDRPAGQRVAARVTVQGTGPGAVRLDGTSSDETADLNNILPFQLERERDYSIRVEHGSRILSRPYRSGTNAQEIVLFCLDERPAFLPASMACAAPTPASQPLKARDRQRLEKALGAYFAAPEQARPALPASLDRLLQRHEPDVRQVAWEQFLKSPAHAALKADHQAGQVRFKEHRSPYVLRTVGSKPAAGWPLFIAMHGGGGAPQELNDRQWQIMQRYYRDHPEVGGYLYLALRAPNNTWNGFYDNYVYPLIETLIRQLVVSEGADPAKVFIMGYSHGGYGAFAIGPKMPDRFAAIHASAAAPTDGETSAKTLRNTLFTFMIGEKDTAHGRIERCRKFDTTVQGLRAGAGAPGAYPVFMQYIADHGHGGLPDRDKITEMYAAVRNPAPPVLAWELTDPVIRDFYWLRVASPTKAATIDASCSGNTVVLQTSPEWKTGDITVKLDSRLVDMTRPVRVELNGVATSHRPRASLRTLCEQLWLRGDADLAFTSEIRITPAQTR